MSTMSPIARLLLFVLVVALIGFVLYGSVPATAFYLYCAIAGIHVADKIIGLI